ncbi:DUF2264 domain-containing protein [Isoptericola variabilis]|uniref:DUF2264 domain-containing protein n=1 Tax=Isoptericola variabilis TaxID=139208 RepID=UPI003D1E3404
MLADEPYDPSPYTGWTRRTWEDHADLMLRSARAFGSSGHARVRLPGPESASGRDSDELEGFARTFLLAAFRLRGAGGQDPLDLTGWYAAGLDAGTDPRSPERWPALDGSTTQSRVEAASIALGLALSREQLWDRLDPRVQGQVVDWLSGAVDARYLEHNWLWFQMVTEAFLRSVGAPASDADRAWGLRRNELLYRADGWYSDGDGREFDHYNGWAFHLYPLLWTVIEPDRELAAAYRDRYEARLRRYLDDAVHLVGADGSPLIQGRSLIYRFAAAAPFWMGALTGATDLAPGLLRRAASGMVAHFADRGAPDERGLLTLGWHHDWPAMRQNYSGSGSPYWASKGMLGLALPASHPVWTAQEEPLPVERGDVLRTVEAPGWVVSGTRADGVVRIANHGTDLAPRGAREPEHPLYARLAYSTATFPPPVGPELASPLANAVALLDADGRASHRTRFEPLGAAGDGVVAVAGSRHRAFWLRDGGTRDAPADGGFVGVTSVLRGAWEVRVVEADLRAASRVRVGGWPLAADAEPSEAPGTPAGAGAVDASGLRSTLTVLHGGAGVEAGLARDRGTSPLGLHTAVPWVASGPADGPLVVAVGLGRAGLDRPPTATADRERLTVVWPDGERTVLDRQAADPGTVAVWRLASGTHAAPVPAAAARPRVVVAIPAPMADRLFGAEERSRLAGLADVVDSPAGGDLSTSAARRALHDADVVLTGWGSGPLEGSMRDLAPRARLLVHAAGSIRPVVDEASLRAGLAVSTMADVNALPVAEYTLAAITFAAKRLLVAARDGQAAIGADDGGYGLTVGVVGASRIGRQVLAGLRERDLHLLVTDPFVDEDDADDLGAERVGLDELFRRSRVVTLHAPLLESTRRMVTAELLAALPDGATLVNTARGGLVDEAALVAELATGRIDAVLDVADEEPPSSGSPLGRLPNVLLTPHVAGTAGNEVRRVGRAVVDELERYVLGRRLRHEVAPDDYARMA